MLKTDKKCKENKFKKFSKKIKNLLYFFFCIEYNMTVIKRNAQRFRLVTFYSSSFSPLSYMDQAQNRKALRLIHFLNFLFAEASGGRSGRGKARSFRNFRNLHRKERSVLYSSKHCYPVQECGAQRRGGNQNGAAPGGGGYIKIKRARKTAAGIAAAVLRACTFVGRYESGIRSAQQIIGGNAEEGGYFDEHCKIGLPCAVFPFR